MSAWLVATAVAFGAVAVPAVAQQVRPLVHAVHGATATAVGVLWHRGLDDDEAGVSGVSRVLAESRLHRARTAAPGVTRCGCSVGRDHALVFGVAPADDPAAVRAFVAALLDDTLPLADDDLRLIVARAALTADDDEFHYPGAMLETAARRRLFAGDPAGRAPSGDAVALSRLTPDDVRRLLTEPAPVRLAALGVVGDAVLRELIALQPGSPPPPMRPRPAPRSVRLDAAPVEYTRVDSPFVAVAFAVGQSSPELALGVEVAKERARRTWKVRGTELLAHAPFVRWSWAEDDLLLQFCRRGEDPEELLPGQLAEAGREDEAAAVQREVQLLLADLRDRPPAESELTAARRSLAVALALPGPGEATAWAAQPALLPGRLQALMLRELHGIDLSPLASATPEGVHTALRAALDPSRASRQTMLPLHRSDFGFRPR